jgi:hypothetical protein
MITTINETTTARGEGNKDEVMAMLRFERDRRGAAADAHPLGKQAPWQRPLPTVEDSPPAAGTHIVQVLRYFMAWLSVDRQAPCFRRF